MAGTRSFAAVKRNRMKKTGDLELNHVLHLSPISPAPEDPARSGIEVEDGTVTVTLPRKPSLYFSHNAL